MIRGSAGGGWCTAGIPSGWRSRRRAGCCRIWLTVLGWESCDHTGPVHEGDTVYSELHVESAEPTEQGGVLRLRSLVYAVSDSADEPDRQVLDWRFSALHF